jgi:hypothetical protein
MGRTGDWDKAEKIMKGFDENLAKNCRVALARAGLALEADIKKRILSSQGMAPLHSFTIQQKKSSKPLIDDGDLVGSVHSGFLDEGTVYVGVNRKNLRGVNLALLHEKGARIKVTPRMRAYLAAKGFRLKRSTKLLVIPARPYVKPAFEDFKEKGITKKLFKEAVQKTLEGK